MSKKQIKRASATINVGLIARIINRGCVKVSFMFFVIGIFLSPLFAIEQILSEFNGQCARFHLQPKSNGQLLKTIQESSGYEIYRKGEKESEFKKIHSFDFITDEAKVYEYLEIDPPTAEVDLPGYKIEKESGFGVQDFIKRSYIAALLSFYDARNASFIGLGFKDCTVDKSKKYSYYIAYKMGSDRYKFPDTPVLIEFKDSFPIAPEIKVIEPVENGFKLKFSPDKKAEYKSGAIIIGYNVYMISETHKEPQKLNDLMLTDIAKNSEIEFHTSELNNGSKIEIYLTAVSFSGTESSASQKKKFMVRSLKVPEAVQKVYVKAVDAGLKVTWARHDDPDTIGYHVYEAIGSNNPNDKFERINKLLIPPDKTEYIVPAKLQEKRYAYRVSAINLWGNESAFSAAGFVDYRDLEKPAAPIMKSVVMANDFPKFSWDINKDQKVKGFLVFRSSDVKGEPVPIADKMLSAQSREFVDKTALAGTTYWYTVRSMSINNVLSEFPAPQKITIDPKSNNLPASNIQFEQTSQGILITWRRSKDPIASGYNIYKMINKKRLKVNETIITKDITQFKDIGQFQRNEKFTYEVVLVNREGIETEAKNSVTIPPAALTLTEPEIRSFRKNQAVHFIWPYDQDYRFATYTLLRKYDGAKQYEKIAEVSGETRQLKDKIFTGKTIYYLVKKSPIAGGKDLYSKIIKIEE